jgi:hypothetical protein
VRVTAHEFTPVLNVPALVAFLVIAFVFTCLRIRVSAIEAASEQRSLLLEKVRDLKSKELNGDNVTHDTVVRAVEDYRQAYDEVERLSALGIARIVTPRGQRDDVAAKQFLGIEQQLQQQPEKDTNLTLPQTALLAVIALSQIVLLLLLLQDPMSSSNMLDIVDTMTGME